MGRSGIIAIIVLWGWMVWAPTFAFPQEATNAQVPVLEQKPFRASEINRNGPFDYLLVVARGVGMAAGLVLAYSADTGASIPIRAVLVPALMGGVTSSFLQFWHLPIKDWLDYRSDIRHPLDFKGIFRLRPEQASFFESFFVKEFSMELIYMQILQAGEFLGGTSSLVSWAVLKTATLGLTSDGLWQINNAKLTGLAERMMPNSHKRIAILSRVAQVGISILLTSLVVSEKMGVEWVDLALKSLQISGVAVIAALYWDQWKKIPGAIVQRSRPVLRKMSMCGQKLKALVQRQPPA